jgi:rhomboid protease GluP
VGIEVKLVKTYLSHIRYSQGKIVVVLLLGLCLMLSNLHWNSSDITLAAQKSLVFEKGEYWRLVSSVFVHGDLDHLLSNSLMLTFLAFFVSSFYGATLTLTISIIGGSLINYLVLLQATNDLTIVGISGVVYFLWGLWLILYLLIDKRLSVIRRLVNILGLFFILLIPTTYSPQTSYLAHYLGFGLGLIAAFIYYPIKAQYFNQFLLYEYKWIPLLEESNSDLDPKL